MCVLSSTVFLGSAARQKRQVEQLTSLIHGVNFAWDVTESNFILPSNPSLQATLQQR